MNIDCRTSLNIRKRVFSIKPVKSDGLVLQVNHTVLSKEKQLLRFVYASYNKYSSLLAAGDHAGNIFIIDIVQNKFWRLPNHHLCTVVKFSTYGNCLDLIIGNTGGKVFLVDIESGAVQGELIGHNQAVKDISFGSDQICLTVSGREAILWDLRNNGKLQVLSVEHDCSIKLALFIPVTNNILACFDDDTVSVWKYGTYEVIKQILPSSRNKQTLKSIAFTRNGRAMVFSGHSSQLTVFMLDAWTIVRVITLPDLILSVKKIEFLPHLFDGGSNRILMILSGNGIIYFYDMEQMLITSLISTEEEITKFDCAPDGKHIACILRSGEINIYRVVQHLPSYREIDVTTEKIKSTNHIRSPSKSTTVMAVRKQIREVLDVDKLHSILKEFGEYPDSYRLTIWTQLLELPNNYHQYNHFINHATQPSFDSIKSDYPLENKIALKNLRKLLYNLVTWSPFFSQVTYLPVFVFPFVKVFQNEPVLCFEAICTIIINWCQHWFEYFPLPPLNILAMIENVLLEHNADLLKHFTYNSFTTKDYAWPLLETAFSEVLTTKEWCTLWDHILSNEPAFLLMSVAAYNILHKETLLSMGKLAEIDTFYHTQNAIDIKRLISKTYVLLNSTSQHNHPRRYLTEFRKLQSGSYSSFNGVPKQLFSTEYNELGILQMEQKHIQEDEIEIMKEREMVRRYMEDDVIQETETKRLAELEKVCHHKITQERQRIGDERRRLVDLRKQLHNKEIEMLNKSRKKISEKNSKQKQRTLEKILNDVAQSRSVKEIEVAKAESELIKHYSELLLHKMRIEEMIYNDQSMSDTSNEYQILKQQQQRLVEELEKIHMDSTRSDYLKQLNVVTSIAAMDDLILRIESELIRPMAEKTSSTSKQLADNKVLKLEAETKQLEMEVSLLLNTLARLKTNETRINLNELNHKVPNRTQETRINSTRLPQNDQKDKIPQIIPLEQDFKRLKNIIQESRIYAIPSASIEDISEEIASINYE